MLVNLGHHSLKLLVGLLKEGEHRRGELRCLLPHASGQELLGTDYVFRKAAADPTLQVDRVREAIAQADKKLRAQGENDLRIMGFADAPAYYANGQRSMLEIRDSIAAEFTPLPLKVIELYFRAFEKAGVMTIEQR